MTENRNETSSQGSSSDATASYPKEVQLALAVVHRIDEVFHEGLDMMTPNMRQRMSEAVDILRSQPMP